MILHLVTLWLHVKLVLFYLLLMDVSFSLFIIFYLLGVKSFQGRVDADCIWLHFNLMTIGKTRCSVQFSRSEVSDSLRPHEPQHARPPCPSPTPRVYPNLCPSNWWCHPTMSSSAVPFSSCLHSFRTLGSFPMSQFFASGGQSIGSFSFSLSPSNKYLELISFRMDWLDLHAVQGTLKSSPTPQFKP